MRPRHKFSVRLGSSLDPHMLVESLRVSQAWIAVTEFQFGDELVVLQPVTESKDEFLNNLLFPWPPGLSGVSEAHLAHGGSVPEALERKCKMAFVEMENRLTARMEA